MPQRDGRAEQSNRHGHRGRIARRLAEQREEDAHQRQARQARRLIADELDTMANHLAMLADKGVFPRPDFLERARFLDAAEWSRHKGTLGDVLDDDADFDLLASFHYSACQLRERLTVGAPGQSLTGAESRSIRKLEVQARVLEGVALGGGRFPPEWKKEREQLREERLARAGRALDDAKPRKSLEESDSAPDGIG